MRMWRRLAPGAHGYSGSCRTRASSAGSVTSTASPRTRTLQPVRVASSTPSISNATRPPRPATSSLVPSSLRNWRRGRDQARLPSWRASTGRGTDRVGWEAAAGQQPRNHRVRVPHLTRPELVSAPDRARQVGNQVEQATRQEWVVAQGPGTCDRFVGVRYDPVPPAAYLVSKRAESRDPAAGDWAFNHHSA